jgi:hypothetical protein
VGWKAHSRVLSSRSRPRRPIHCDRRGRRSERPLWRVGWLTYVSLAQSVHQSHNLRHIHSKLRDPEVVRRVR